jgi:hypothetical protein
MEYLKKSSVIFWKIIKNQIKENWRLLQISVLKPREGERRKF